jgi:hypothetical protein
MLKADGTVMVWSDADGYKVKPLNWMVPPTTITDEGDVLVVTKREGKSQDKSGRSGCTRSSATTSTTWARQHRSRRTARGVAVHT